MINGTLFFIIVCFKVAMDTSVVTAVGIHHSNPDVRRLTFSNMCQQINDGETIEVLYTCHVILTP